jgi:hypothetical protein
MQEVQFFFLICEGPLLVELFFFGKRHHQIPIMFLAQLLAANVVSWHDDDEDDAHRKHIRDKQLCAFSEKVCAA